MSDYDVVIVGAGPSGAILARYLGAAGKKVLVLEAGGDTGKTWIEYQANVDQYHGSSVRVPNSPYYFSEFAPTANVLDINAIPPGGVDANGYLVQRGPLPFGSDYARAKGGTTLHWEGTSLRMVPNDFELQSRYQRGVDWPIDYDDLSPFYEQAEHEFGVSADVEDQGYLGIKFSQDYVYPMHRLPLSYSDQVMAKALNKKTVPVGGDNLPVDVTSTPCSRNSIPNPKYNKGAGYEPVGAVGNPHRGHRCEGNSSCIPICPVQAKYSALKTLAAVNANVTIITQAVVSKVLLSTDNEVVIGVEYSQYQDGLFPPFPTKTVTADIYVLAGNAIENAKLLLASNVPNTSGQIGLNLMDHPFLMRWGLMSESVGAFRGPASPDGIEVTRDGKFRAKRAAFRVEIANWGWDFCGFAPYVDVEAAVHAQNLFGQALRSQLLATTPRQVRFGFLLEQLPSAGNKVTIDNAWTDALGNPRPVIDYDLDDYVKDGFAAAAEMTAGAFKLMNCTEKTSYSPGAPGYVQYNGADYAYNGSGHVCGTHRMGKTGNLGDGVVDPDQRCHDHPNLYVVGCGSMPTVATSNPTLTMGAMVFRSLASILADLGGPS